MTIYKGSKVRLAMLLVLLSLSLGYFLFPTVYVVDLSTTPFYSYYREYQYHKILVQGDAKTQRQLGYIYDKGIGVPQDYDKALKLYKKAAEQGDIKAQNNLGVCYEEGKSVEQDNQKTIFWYTKAAEQGYLLAQMNLAGFFYNRGEYEEAFPWVLKAAEAGKSEAQNTLGWMYRHGNGVDKNPKRAFDWYRKAAEQGNSDAQFRLAYAYDVGEGVERDQKQAAIWYKKLAANENRSALHNLGLIYQYSEDVGIDLEQAFHWYKKAAELGHPEAQYKVANCYLKGIGVPQNNVEVYAWFYTYMFSKKSDEKNAKDFLSLLDYRIALFKSLTNEQKEKARKKANEYLTKYNR